MRRPAMLVLSILASFALAACNQADAAAGKAFGGDMSLGNPKAKVTVVEYASVMCPHCARFNADTYPAFKAKYVDTGRINYVFKEVLTQPAPVAAAGFLLARCAGKDKYFDVVDAVFRSQQEIYTSGAPRDVLLRIGRSAGMSDEKALACISDEKALLAVNERSQQAVTVDKIPGTPSFSVNGKHIGSGALPLAQLEAAIDPLL
jgi:protein-disulfide isomerase